MANITKDLGVSTAYGYHKAGGGTLTEAEFEQKMVDITTAADDAEAYGAGTRGGTAVPSTDDAYHNNAKYYKEQAEQSAQSILQSATQIATNTSDIADLKEDLSQSNDDIYNALNFVSALKEADFEHGSIDSSGQNKSYLDTGRVRNISVQYTSEDLTFTVNAGYRAIIVLYGSYAVTDFISLTTWLNQGTITAGSYYRLLIHENHHVATDTAVLIAQMNMKRQSKIANAINTAITTASTIINGIKPNMFNRDAVNTGKLKDSDGSIDTTVTDWITSDYIPIDNSKKYEVYNFTLKTKRTNDIVVCVYTSDLSFVDYMHIRPTGEDLVHYFTNLNKYTFPDTATYIRISFSGVYIDAVMVVNNAYVPKIYTGYDTKDFFRNANYKRGTTIKSYGKEGYNTLDRYPYLPTYPHSSIPSFLGAMYAGFDALWVAVLYTSDDVPVLCHNQNVYSFATNADGTALTNPYNITEHTYAEVSALDFGRKYGSMYNGMHILTLEDGIRFAKYFGTNIIVEVEVGETDVRVQGIANLLKKYGMGNNCGMFSYGTAYLRAFNAILPNADLFKNAGSDIVASATNVATLKTTGNSVYVIAQFNQDYTAETIDQIMALGVGVAFSNPDVEPTSIVSLLTQDKYAYVDTILSRVMPAWKCMRDTLLT